MEQTVIESLPEEVVAEWINTDAASYYAARFGVGDIPIDLISSLKENSYE